MAIKKSKKKKDTRKAKCKSCKGTGYRKAVHGRNKGGTFERKIAAKVGDWLSIKLHRTPQSGGWAKTGDITPKDPAIMDEFPINIECKNQESLIVGEFLKKIIHQDQLQVYIEKWWKQCTKDAEVSKRVPLLIFTSNNNPEFCMMDRKDFKTLNLIVEEMAMATEIIGKRVVFFLDDLIQYDAESVYKKLLKMRKKLL